MPSKETGVRVRLPFFFFGVFPLRFTRQLNPKQLHVGLQEASSVLALGLQEVSHLYETHFEKSKEGDYPQKGRRRR